MKVISFPNDKQTTDTKVIARLEEALAMAQMGNISNCMIIMAVNDGSVVDCWANGNKPFIMVGALESIKREFMDALIEKR